MGPELDELKSSSAGTGLKTPGQQCPPNEGIWEPGRTTASGILTAAVDSSQGGRIPPTTECEDTREPVKRVQELRQTPPPYSRATKHSANKTSSSTPVGEERRPRLGRRL